MKFTVGLTEVGIGAAGVAMIVGAFLVAMSNNAALKAEIITQRGCVGALVMPGAGSTGSCEPALVKLVDQARAAQACDAALAEGNLSPACSAPVQQMAVERASLADQLTQLQADSSAAIIRAEQRGQNTQKRKTQDAAALQAAPVVDGLIVCDARCLRRRAGEVDPD